MSVLNCKLVPLPSGVVRYERNGAYVLDKMPDGTFVDYRIVLGYSPPFLQIIPCPYCGTEKNSEHDPHKHINTHILTQVKK